MTPGSSGQTRAVGSQLRMVREGRVEQEARDSYWGPKRRDQEGSGKGHKT